MQADWFDTFKAACCRIDTPQGTGTGYLVDEQRVVTCEHVVRGVDEGSTADVAFADRKLSATVVKKDDLSDSAILKLNEPAQGIAPLQFARNCNRQAVWDGYGYPGIAGGIGLPLQGTIMDPKSRDKKQRPSLLVFSQQVLSKSDVHGYSGSPVVVGGFVIGHLKRIIGDEDDPTKPAYGYVFASPAAAVLALVGLEPSVEEVQAEDPRQLQIPALPDGAFHVFISANSANRSFGKRLLQEMEAKGFRVAASWTSDGDGLANAKSAVAVLSADYLNSALSRSEGDAIQQRRASGLRVLPVRVDDTEFPARWMTAISYDFRGMSKPEGPMLEQLLYAVAGQRPRVQAVAAMAETSSEADPEKARALINAGLPDLALKCLPASDPDVRVRQVRALALAKNRQVDDAIVLLEQLRKENLLDGETGGLLAGRYRQRWNQSKTPALFNAALDLYLTAWRESQPPNPYPGINAASMMAWNGDVEGAKKIAGEVLGRIDAKAATDFWDLATIAEAHVLLGETDEALRFYRKMIVAGPERYENIATARKTLRVDLDKLKLPAEPFEDLLQLPEVAAFVGHDIDAPDRAARRFPREWEPCVRDMIAKTLQDQVVMFGVSSAGGGSDIIFLEEMKQRNGYVRVILPCGRGRFMRDFLDKEWALRFEEAMDYPRAEVVELDEGDPEELWLNLRPKLWKYAEATAAQLEQKPKLIAVWDGNPGFINDTVTEWRARRADVYRVPLTAESCAAGATASSGG